MTTPYWTRPEPPYYVVIFTITPSGADPDGYAAMNERMVGFAERQPGYLGRETALIADGSEMTTVYYTDAASIQAWRRHPEHLEAQRLGREKWLARFRIEIARVERAYDFTAPVSGTPSAAAPDS